jgi:hypothetical protein
MAKETKVKKRRKRKWKRTVAILSFVIVMGTIITFSILHPVNLPLPPVPKRPASEYFSFSDVFAIAEPQDSKNKTILIIEVDFMIKAVEGNATDVTIIPLQGYVDVENAPHFNIISQGASETVDVEYALGVISTKTAEGYPLEFRIYSVEATGEVTIYVTGF